MQGLKLTLQDIDTFIKQTKREQQQQLKSIRNTYKQFIQKDEPNFTNVVKRIQTNLKNMTEDSLTNCVYSININQQIQKFKQRQLAPINKQIQQARVIMNKGAGMVQKRQFIASKTQKMNIQQSQQPEEFRKTHAGFMNFQKIKYNEEALNQYIDKKIPAKKYNRESEISAIKIQRWWRQFKPDVPIYKHEDYFD